MDNIYKALKLVLYFYPEVCPKLIILYTVYYIIYLIDPTLLEPRQFIRESNIYKYFIQMNHISKALILFLMLNITSMIPPFIIFYKRHKDLANNIIV